MGNLISEIRKRFKVSQVQMSIDTGLNREFINKMENGKVEISEKTIGLLNQVYKEDGSIKPHIEQESGFIEGDNLGSMNSKTQNNIGLNEISVHSIIETNRNISRTLEKMVDTNAQFALLLKSILPSKSETHQGVHQDVLSKMSQMLEYMVEIGAGKRWETKEGGLAELNKRFFGSQEILEEMDSNKKMGK